MYACNCGEKEGRERVWIHSIDVLLDTDAP